MNKAPLLLRVLRAAQEPKITQSQLARKAGLSAARYWQIENGEGADSTRTERDAIAIALGIKSAQVAWPTPQREVAS